MIPHDPATSLPILHVDRGDQIPEVTLAFWVIKVAATTLGRKKLWGDRRGVGIIVALVHFDNLKGW